jgi:hypothetical protein
MENKHWTVTVEEDPATGDLILPFPPDMLAQVGWDFGDTLIWDQHEDGSFVLHKKMTQDQLDYDLRTTDWILEKVRNRDDYAQNIYAALCNMRWQKLDVMPILTDQYWSCTWRSAGGIVAELLERGDYLDWYCSGARDDDGSKGYVSESTVTDEIREDFKKLGWQPIPYDDKDLI